MGDKKKEKVSSPRRPSVAGVPRKKVSWVKNKFHHCVSGKQLG